MSNLYQQHMLKIIEELRAQGVSRFTSAPPAYRILWRLGFQVPPPFYLSFSRMAITYGGAFAMAMIVLYAGMFLAFRPAPLTAAFVVHYAIFGGSVCLVAGAITGVSSAMYYRWRARKLRLPPLPSAGELTT